MSLVKPADDRREIYNGFGDALAKAVELLITPAVFAWVGWLIDGWVGTRLVFTLTLASLVFLYSSWRMWFEYEQKMRAEEEKLGIGRARVTGGPPGA